ncbi:cell division cycle-associated protein 7-like [Synchiropus picturatus]
MNPNMQKLARVFADGSDSDDEFLGFSEAELSKNPDQASDLDEDDDLESTIQPSRGAKTFQLRIALRPNLPLQLDEEEDDEVPVKPVKRGVKRGRKPGVVNREKRVKVEEQETPADAPAQNAGSESSLEVSDSFLAKREQNIRANKAMLAQLMADLQNMPGGPGLLKKEAARTKKGKRDHAPRSAESRRNPERASRRQTRSMGACEDLSLEPDPELELSLEDQLLKVQRSPRRRNTSRSTRPNTHRVRQVDEITQDELLLIADNMTDKVYDKVAGSTCHQCRQKTNDTKTCCRSEDCRGIQGQFCGPCLRNRYGEDVRTALLDPEWRCPPCRGICNCSFCRQREGRCPTGILIHLAQHHGFSDVHSYLVSLRNKLKDDDEAVEE